MDLSDTILKRRRAVEQWKANNREYYLRQKRQLSARPEYRAKMRARYASQQTELREAGIIPRKLGRPRLYDGEEALEVKRQRGKEATARYRLRKISQLQEKNHHDSTNTSECENSDRSSDSSGCSA